ncbi:MAG: SgcJ/EcaC family oxidoreductase [Balneolaceae bacterium]
MSKALKLLQQRHNEWIEIVNRCDLEGYVELLAEDGVWLPPGGKPVEGRDAFREWLEPFFSRFEYDFSITDARFRESGGRAISKGKFISVMTPKEGGDSMQHSGTFTVLWHRNGDEWYIDRYIDDTGL